MMKRVAVAVAVLFAAPALAQNVKQGGTIIPGDLSKFQSNGQIVSGGNMLGDTKGKGVNPFSVEDRGAAGLCIRTAASGAAHNALCFGHDGQGNALITVDGFGGAAPKGFQCRINGVLSDCFNSGGVVPPPSGSSEGCLLVDATPSNCLLVSATPGDVLLIQ